MVRYLFRRTLWAIGLFVVITLITFVIFILIPVDPAKNACGQRATPTCIEIARKYFGLDAPVHEQYLRFLWRVTYHHDLGISFHNRQKVNGIVLQAAPVTASIAVGGLTLMLMLAFPIGILSALRPRSKLDRFAMTWSLALISLPTFWLGLVAAYVISFKLGWTPIAGYCDVFTPSTSCGGVAQWAWHLVLPWTVFAVHHSAYYIRMIRATLMESLSEDYVKTARAKGAPEWRVISSHAMRNAILPIVTMFGMDLGFVLGGLFFIEYVFGLPGLGALALDSIANFDLPVTMGVVIFGTVAILAANLVVDLLYAWIDPRIRLA